MSKTVSLHYPEGSTYTGNGRSVRYPAYDKVVSYPDECVLHYDANQGCLLIKTSSGEPVAAFRVPSFTVDETVEVGDPVAVTGRPTHPEGRAGQERLRRPAGRRGAPAEAAASSAAVVVVSALISRPRGHLACLLGSADAAASHSRGAARGAS